VKLHIDTKACCYEVDQSLFDADISIAPSQNIEKGNSAEELPSMQAELVYNKKHRCESSTTAAWGYARSSALTMSELHQHKSQYNTPIDLRSQMTKGTLVPISLEWSTFYIGKCQQERQDSATIIESWLLSTRVQQSAPHEQLAFLSRRS
jgi:hypothetical protein